MKAIEIPSRMEFARLCLKREAVLGAISAVGREAANIRPKLMFLVLISVNSLHSVPLGLVLSLKFSSTFQMGFEMMESFSP